MRSVPFLPLFLVCASLSLSAADKVEVASLPEAVKAAVTIPVWTKLTPATQTRPPADRADRASKR